MPGEGHWPTFQGNAARTGWQRAATAPTPPVDCAWTYETATEFGSGVGEFSPAVADGTVYLHTNSGTIEDVLHALNPATGETEWIAGMGGRVTSSPAVADDTVFVQGGGVAAFDAATGTETWHVDIGESVHGSPAVVDGTAFIGYKGDLYALHTGTGRTIWSVTLRGVSVSSVAVAGGRLFVESNDQYLYALESGSETATA